MLRVGKQGALPRAFPRRPARAWSSRTTLIATGLAVACVVLSSSAALADQVRNQEWWLRALHVTTAWDSSRGSGVAVAVLGTGVDRGQADLAGAVITGPDYTHSGRLPGGQFWGSEGTAMATLVGGRGHGAGHAKGIIGIAPAARILSVRVTLEQDDPLLSDSGIAAGLPAAIAKGIRYAVRRGAGVIDVPLDPVTAPGSPGAGGSQAERAAVAYALRKHVVVVAPAGDITPGSSTGPVNFPAAYPGVISVGAFDSGFNKAPFSSRQPYVTLTAAGDGVIAAAGKTGYSQVSSTSAASAVVAGIAALIRAQFPRLTPAQVRRALTSSTGFRRAGGRASGSGSGTVDAQRALLAAARIGEAVPSAAAPAPAPPSQPAVKATGKSLRRTLTRNGIIAGGAFAAMVLLILGIAIRRRRRARAARLAPARQAGQPRRSAQTPPGVLAGGGIAPAAGASAGPGGPRASSGAGASAAGTGAAGAGAAGAG
ncbi:MAG: S8 family serine peptidase, partial [Nocardiopsaceae bacterium]|nr:S8 family serine peptidase [Nocardiopsaceae bacterium]